MSDSIKLTGSSIEYLMFEVCIEGKHYSCPISRAAIHELCKDQDPDADRMDAYLAFKEKIRSVITRHLQDGLSHTPHIPATFALDTSAHIVQHERE
jgi:hypothetical protein